MGTPVEINPITKMAAGGRSSTRWPVVLAVWVLCSAGLLATGDPQDDPEVVVSESHGVYAVTATFTVPQKAASALATLTDYPAIPRFMPEVRTSNVLERSDDRAIVEQEGVARFLMFSKRVHLVLEIQQEPGAIRFRDRCGKSFARYEGAWTLADADGSTHITYELSAQPSFDVPEFLLKRLLKRDASQMIERLKTEIGARARQLTD